MRKLLKYGNSYLTNINRKIRQKIKIKIKRIKRPPLKKQPIEMSLLTNVNNLQQQINFLRMENDLLKQHNNQISEKMNTFIKEEIWEGEDKKPDEIKIIINIIESRDLLEKWNYIMMWFDDMKVMIVQNNNDLAIETDINKQLQLNINTQVKQLDQYLIDQKYSDQIDITDFENL